VKRPGKAAKTKDFPPPLFGGSEITPSFATNQSLRSFQTGW